MAMILKTEGSQLFYSKQGSGSKSLLLFHGFGQDHTSLQSIVNSLSEQYTTYSFDLYFHGQSSWINIEKSLEKREWKQILELFIKENNLNQFSVLGYSLGGKFALATLEGFPDHVKEIFLIAPDGIKINSWYRLATYPLVMRKIFKGMINNYEIFLGVAKLCNSLGLLDKTVMRFADSQMNTKEKRRRVYYSWVVFRHLSFSMKTLGFIIRKKQIRLIVIVGKYDKIIKAGHMKRLLHQIENYQFKILETGHNHLLEKSNQFLADYLRSANKKS